MADTIRKRLHLGSPNAPDEVPDLTPCGGGICSVVMSFRGGTVMYHFSRKQYKALYLKSLLTWVLCKALRAFSLCFFLHIHIIDIIIDVVVIIISKSSSSSSRRRRSRRRRGGGGGGAEAVVVYIEIVPA